MSLLYRRGESRPHPENDVCRAQDAAKKLSAAKAELEKHSERLAEAEQGITQVMGELERLSAKRTYLRCASSIPALDGCRAADSLRQASASATTWRSQHRRHSHARRVCVKGRPEHVARGAQDGAGS